MSLTKWVVYYVVTALVFGWVIGGDRELRKGASRRAIWLIGFLVAMLWFVIGLVFPDLRLYIVGEPAY